MPDVFFLPTTETTLGVQFQISDLDQLTVAQMPENSTVKKRCLHLVQQPSRASAALDDVQA